MLENKYIRKLNPYKVVAHRAWGHASSEDVLKLDWNEATVPPSPGVFKAIETFLKHNPLSWYPNLKNELLLDAIAAYCDVARDCVQYFASSDSLHENILRTYIEYEDKVAMVAPTYDNFRATAESLGGVVDYVFLQDDYGYEISDILQRLERINPKLIYVCNPNNPTGTLWSVQDICTICDRFPQSIVVVDEAYYEFAGVSVSTKVSDFSNLIVTRTFSKALALASFRIGFAVASPKIIESLNLIRNPKNITGISQVAALAALEDIDYTQRFVEEVKRARTWTCDALLAIDSDYFSVTSQLNGNFIMFTIPESDTQTFLSFLEVHKIYIRYLNNPLVHLNALRVSVGTLAQMKRFIDVVKEFYGSRQ